MNTTNKPISQLGSEQESDSAKNLTGEQQLLYEVAQMTSKDLLGPARVEGEKFEAYQIRRKRENLWHKIHQMGYMAWVATDPYQDESTGFWFNRGGGTYRKDVHGELE